MTIKTIFTLIKHQTSLRKYIFIIFQEFPPPPDRFRSFQVLSHSIRVLTLICHMKFSSMLATNKWIALGSKRYWRYHDSASPKY